MVLGARVGARVVVPSPPSAVGLFVGARVGALLVPVGALVGARVASARAPSRYLGRYGMTLCRRQGVGEGGGRGGHQRLALWAQTLIETNAIGRYLSIRMCEVELHTWV